MPKLTGWRLAEPSPRRSPRGSRMTSLRRLTRLGPPSIPAVIFVALVLLVSIGLQQPLLNSDGDLARHLRHGQYMLEHHALVRADPFSYTPPGKPFVAFEYGSQVAYALASQAGGLPGVAVLAGLL